MTDEFTSGLDVYVRAVLARKALHPVVLDVRNLTSVADAFIICSGQSNRQVTAIAETVQKELKKQKILPLSVEGAGEGHWVLLDYGHVIIHVFYEPIREFYDLEGLWMDAKQVRTDSMGSRNKRSRRSEVSDDSR